jgi:excisionase family DNA binding protein
MVALPSSNHVRPDQRHTRRNPCRICGGFDTDRRGRGERCYGWLGDDGYEHCTREEYAGDLQRTSAGTFAHRIDGQLCRCGQPHEGGSTPDPSLFRAAPTTTKPQAERKPQRGLFPSTAVGHSRQRVATSVSSGNPPEQLLLTIDAAAAAMSISRAHAYRLVQRGELPTIRLGRSRRVVRTALDAFITRLEQEQGGIE